MNYKILNLLLISLCLTTEALATIPQAWIHEQSEFNMLTNFETQAATENLKTEEDFHKLFNTGYEIIDPDTKPIEPLLFGNKKKSKTPWYLQSMKAELGIEASGDIGFVGLSAEAAIELIWTRTAWSIRQLQKKHFGVKSDTPLNLEQSENTSTLTLDTHMAPGEVATQIDGLVDYIATTKKVSNLNLLRTQLLEKVLVAQEFAEKTEEISSNATWKPYKYQLELFVQAEGMVMPATMVGGVIRLRFQWDIKPKVVLAPTQVSKFWDQLGPQFNNLQALNAKPDDYQLVAVKMGVGFGMSGDIGIAEGKFSVVGSVFLKPSFPSTRNSLLNLNSAGTITNRGISCKDLTGPANDNIPFYYSDTKLTQDKIIFSPISRMIFCKSIEKVSSIAGFITRAATTHERKRDLKKKDRKFELGHIEIELELSASGNAFLPTVKKKASFEIFYTKKNKL